LQVGIAYINHIRKISKPSSSHDLESLQGKWDKLCRLMFEYTLSAASEKASVEEMCVLRPTAIHIYRREQARRKLTAAILKLQTIYLKLANVMSHSGNDFQVEAFTTLLHILADLSKSTQSILSEV
jgi:hypothetical protein